MLRMDPFVFRMGPFSQGRRTQQAMTVIPTRTRPTRRIVEWRGKLSRVN
jgi:hypothetical protein